MGWRMEKVEKKKDAMLPILWWMMMMALLSSLRSYGWSGELAGDRPNHQQSEGPLGSCARQCPQLQGLLHSGTRRRGANGGESFFFNSDKPRLLSCSYSAALKCFNTELLSTLTMIRWTHCHADSGLNILLNRRRCQEAPPPPPWGTWILTSSTMLLLFPFIQMWRAYGRPRRERQVSDSRGSCYKLE